MGLQIEFYAGDADEIGSAFTAMELEELRDGTLAHAYADLSLHISPTDLDTLSEQVGAVLGQPAILLLDSLEGSVGGTPGESDASVVSPAWVAAVGAVSSDSAAPLTRRWMQAVADEAGEEVAIDSPEAIAAVNRITIMKTISLHLGLATLATALSLAAWPAHSADITIPADADGAAVPETRVERVVPAPAIEERTTTTTTTTQPAEPRRLTHDERERLEKERKHEEKMREAEKHYQEDVFKAERNRDDD